MKIVIVFIVLLTSCLPSSTFAQFNNTSSKYGVVISVNTEWKAVSGVSSNQTVAGTPMGFRSLMKGYMQSTKYKTEIVEYNVSEWDLFGLIVYNKDKSFREGLLFSSPRTGYSDCGFDAFTVFLVEPKNSTIK